ncbi:MAG: NAD(P)/FAD-dependent oxidoreductase [Desulfurococcales archaeon]|nr:NAD(P)/FAD-dependent oxidoreductase [Desulfurococcales archaeon]
MASISIVGGGVAGLLVARELAKHGYNVELFEEHRAFGVPRHCTGLVSEFTFRALGRPACESRVMRFNSYIIASCDLSRDIELLFNEHVYLLDRVRLEKLISIEAQCSGATLRLGTYVRNVMSSGKVEVLGGGKKKYDYVVLAEGAIRKFARDLGLCPRKLSSLKGFQAIAVIKKAKLDRPLIIACNSVCRDFFAWVVPYGNEGNYIVGVASAQDIYLSFTKLLKLISKHYGSEVVIVKHFGGLMPVSKPCALARGNVVGVGDSISLVKPVSGGGIYSIVLEVEALVKAFKGDFIDKGRYYGELSKLRKLITFQRVFKKLLTYFGGYEGVINVLLSLGIRKIVVGDYDSLELNLAETVRHLIFAT